MRMAFRTKDTEIKHIFVLMMENRSFDHMLGYSNLQGINGCVGQNLSNLDALGEKVPTTPDADYSGDFEIGHVIRT